MKQSKKRISPTEHIANTPHPGLESIHVKVSGYSPRHVSLSRSAYIVEEDKKAIRDYLKKAGRKHYTLIHTHPDSIQTGSDEYISRKPDDLEYRQPQTNASFGDIADFLSNKRQKYDAISQVDAETGETSGYVYYKKKNNPTSAQIQERRKVTNCFLGIKRLDKKISRLKGKTCNPKEQEELRLLEAERSKLEDFFENQSNRAEFALLHGGWNYKSRRLEEAESLAKQYGLIYRFVPVPSDHPVNKKRRGIESTLGIISIAGFLFSALFLSGITGNVISNLSQNYPNIIGAVSFLIGVVGAFFYFRGKQ